MRVGVLGGTFDPIHIGHLILGEEARLALALDRVIFIPAAEPWRKAWRPIAPAEDRLAMVELAIEDNPYFVASATEIERSGPTFTADTLEVLAAAAVSSTFWFILGSDALMDMPNWKDPARILAQARLAVGARAEVSAEQLAALYEKLPGASSRIDQVTMPPVSVSSSELRRRIHDGISTRYWLPDAVGRYALARGLYAAAAPAG